jgi:glycine cleavage system H protein
MSESKIPEELRYTKSHEWVRWDGEMATVGITDYAQGELTDIVFVDPPAAGKIATTGATVMVLESVKTVSDIYAPVAGVVAEGNAELKSHPELVNRDPYGRGWLFKIKTEGPPQPELLTAEQYRALLASGA